MEKTINIDFNNSSSITLGYSADILYSGVPHWADSTHTHGNLFLFNLTGTSASNGLTLSVAPPNAAANAVFGGSYISLVTSGVSTTVHVTGLQPAGAYLTTAAESDHSHGIAAATGMISGTIGSGTNWSLSIPDFLLTAAQSDHTHSQYIPIGNSTQYATSYLVNTFLTTAALSTHIHGVASGTNITIGSSSNGLALSVGDALGINTSLATITGSVPTMVGNTSGLTLNLPNFVTAGNNLTLDGNTLGTLTIMSSGVVTVAGGDNITLSQDGNAFTIIGAGITATATGANAVYAGDNISISTDGVATTVSVIGVQTNTLALQGSGTYTQDSGTIQFANSNSVSFGLTDNQMTASIPVHSLVFSDSNGISWSSSTSGLSTTIIASIVGGGGAGGAALQGSGTYTQNTGTIQFANSNGITFGLIDNQMTASHNAYSASSQISQYFADILHTHSNLYINISNSTQFVNVTDISSYNPAHTHGDLALTNLFGTSSSDGLSLSASLGSVYFVNSLNTNLTWYSSESAGSTSIYASVDGGTTVGGGSGGFQLRITSNTSGTSTIVSSGTLTLGGGDGITLSQNGNRIDIIGGVGSICFTDGSNVTWGSSVFGNNTSIFLTAGGGGGGGGNIAIANSQTTYSTGTVIISGDNLTVNSSTTGSSQYLQLAVPPMGYLFFNDILGFSFTSSTDGVSTTVGLSTA
jgi:hypothetical protein